MSAKNLGMRPQDRARRVQLVRQNKGMVLTAAALSSRSGLSDPVIVLSDRLDDLGARFAVPQSKDRYTAGVAERETIAGMLRQVNRDGAEELAALPWSGNTGQILVVCVAAHGVTAGPIVLDEERRLYFVNEPL